MLRRIFTFRGLGSHTAPTTFWQSESRGEELVLDFEESVKIDSVFVYLPLGRPDGAKDINPSYAPCRFSLYVSGGDGNWLYVGDLESGYPFSWREYPFSFYGRYLKIVSVNPGRVLGEIVPAQNSAPVSFSPVSPEGNEGGEGPLSACDEAGSFAGIFPRYFYGTYFDEVYFARTAYEYARGFSPYENTHPPLAKLITRLGVKIFGMNPFGYRVFSALASVALVPAVYFLAIALGAGKKAAFFASFLLAADSLRLAVGRIATSDGILCLFIILSFLFMALFLKKFQDVGQGGRRYLAASGFFLGCAASVKWSGLYIAPALAVVFFWVTLKSRKGMPFGRAAKKLSGLYASCLVFFVAIPAAVYFASFIPLLGRTDGGVAEFFKAQRDMFSYHHSLSAGHPYSSRWYRWIFGKKAMGYSFSESGGLFSVIYAFLNPVATLFAPVSVALCLFEFAAKKGGLACFGGRAGYLFCLLPWAFVSRITFIYHYFPSLCFGFVCRGVVLGRIREKGKTGKAAVCFYLALLGLAFLILYPAASGLPVTEKYLEAAGMLAGATFY